MTEPLSEFSLKNLISVRDRTNSLFKKRGIIFFRQAFNEPQEILAEQLESFHPIQDLHIERSDTPAFYEKITNSTKFQEAINKMIRVDTVKLQQQLQVFLKEHKSSMPDDVADNLQIFLKYIVQFQRRAQMALRTSFEDCTDVSSVQDKARDVLTKVFKEGLITYVMPSLLEGLKQNSAFYKWVAGYFNDFLEQYGIYTIKLELNQEIDYDVLNPESPEVTDKKELHGKISDLLLLPYFFNDERYNGKALLCEGNCIGWRFEN
jgi:hypothetical protein